MERYTSTQEIAFGDVRETRGITVKGSVVVATWDNTEFIDTDTLTTGSYEYFTQGLRLRFTLTGTSFSIDRGELK